jgi:c-di-GMP-binding flagellar brake protein YcgR
MNAISVNERVRVRVEGLDLDLTSRVEDVKQGQVTIARPFDGEKEHDIEMQTVVTLEWISARGLHICTGVVSARAWGQTVPAVIVDVPVEPELIQRREYVRANAEVPVELEVSSEVEGEEPTFYSGKTVDLSGGGMRLRVEAPLTANLRVGVTMTLPDQPPMRTEARVVREVEENTFSFEFVNLNAMVEDRIVRFVFDLHRQAHARARKVA